MNLVARLCEKGYTVDVRKHGSYDFAMVTGKHVTGGFCSAHDISDKDAS
ncbi:hypothetical protein ACFVS2_25265 [Brevibacillus sp. NPDC058079]